MNFFSFFNYLNREVFTQDASYLPDTNEMSYKLVIAEKPSVAQSIAKVIGADKREDGYLEGKTKKSE